MSRIWFISAGIQIAGRIIRWQIRIAFCAFVYQLRTSPLSAGENPLSMVVVTVRITAPAEMANAI